MSLIPLFDPNAELVGWMWPGEHIFDTDMNWAAYIGNDHAWSAETGNWLGPIKELNCLDRTGRIVAWSREGRVVGSVRPVRPVRAVRAVRPVRPVHPVHPVRPVRPVSPVGGWSAMSWVGWLSQ